MLKKTTSLLVGSFLVAVSSVGIAGGMGECTQFESDPALGIAKHILVVRGNTSCASLRGQVGCRIYRGQGSCTVKDPETGQTLFRASSGLTKEGSVDWIIDGEFKADTVLVGGAKGGKACGYFYPDDADAGKGLGFLNSNGTFAHVKFVDVCSDLINKPEPIALPECPADVQAALDEQKLAGTDLAITYKFDDKVGVVSSFCVRGGLASSDVQIAPCLNEPVKNVNSTDNPLCSEVVSPETGLPFEIGSLNTYDVVGAVGSSCAKTCLPPPLTFGGGAQCAIICK